MESGSFEAYAVAEGVVVAAVDLQIEVTDSVGVERKVDLDVRILVVEVGDEVLQSRLAVVPEEENVILEALPQTRS